jgi:hemolysin-activating ACP:hemolysin acyltransferase
VQYNYRSKLLKDVIEESKINWNSGADMPKIKTSANMKFSRSYFKKILHRIFFLFTKEYKELAYHNKSKCALTENSLK